MGTRKLLVLLGISLVSASAAGYAAGDVEIGGRASPFPISKKALQNESVLRCLFVLHSSDRSKFEIEDYGNVERPGESGPKPEMPSSGGYEDRGRQLDIQIVPVEAPEKGPHEAPPPYINIWPVKKPFKPGTNLPN